MLANRRFMLHSSCFLTHRINIGYNHLLQYAYTFLAIKYPSLRGFLSYKYMHVCLAVSFLLFMVQTLISEHCYVALSYSETLRAWEDTVFVASNMVNIQLPYQHLVGSNLARAAFFVFFCGFFSAVLMHRCRTSSKPMRKKRKKRLKKHDNE